MRLNKFLLLSALILSSLLAVIACRLTAEGDKEVHTLTLESLFDTLKTFDNVQVQLKNSKTGALTVIFNDKVDDSADVRNLAAPGYDGKTITIVITASNGGVTAYKVERVFDGASNTTVSAVPFITPDTRLVPESDAQRIYEGDTMPLPKIRVSPSNLADSGLVWKSLDPAFLLVRDSTLMIGVARGTAKLQVKLKSDPSKELVLNVTVAPKPGIPDSLYLSPETLFVAAKGAAKKVKTAFVPVTADPSLTWHSSNEEVAVVTASGSVYGLAKGEVRVWAESRLRAGVSDTIRVSVSERVPALTLRFPDDTLYLFLGGSAAPLVTQIAPSLANPEVDFTVRDPSKAELLEDRIKAKAVGGTYVVAVSRDNPSLKDSIRVEVLGAQQVDSVSVIPATFRVFTGGKEFQLTPVVHPQGAYAKVLWRSLNPEWAVVNAQGAVSAVAPGLARIECTSLADSSKRDTVTADVDQDPPVLTVGRDTTITQGQSLTFSPEVAQNYGGIAKFAWDVDGKAGYEDSADGLKPIAFKYLKEAVVPVQFYVRDGEGNWDTVQFKVTVKPSPLVVNITFPPNDTSVNTPSLKVRYTVNGIALERTVRLQEGTRDVLIDTANEAGTGRDSVRITLDTTAPVIRISSPTAGQAFNKDSVAVAWTVDGNAQTHRLMAQLGKQDGAIDIVRDSTDKAGNKGSLKVTVVRDTRNPKVIITSPKDSTHVKSAIVAVAWTADSAAQKTENDTLKDGLNLVRRRFMDAAGNLDSATARVYYHSKAPVVEILSPSDSTIATSARLTVSWTVDGAAQKTDTSVDLKDGDNPIVRTHTDEVGQTGKDSLLVIYNPGATNVKITSPLPGTFTNLLTIPVSWTANGVDKGTQAESLKVEGDNIITRKFKDGAQLEGTGTVKVVRDTKNPNAPTLNVPAALLITTANASAAAAWTWSSGGDNAGGSGSKSPKAYRYILDGAAAVNIAAETYTLANPADGAHTLQVQEQDKAGNWSASSAMRTITVDKTPPTAPVVAGETPSADPAWTWTAGGGGNGTFRFRLDAAAYAGNTTAKRYNPAQLTNLDHTLYVQEQDDHGNWSAEKPYLIKANLASPTVPSSAGLACSAAGSATDTVEAEMDSEGYHALFDGKTLKGWWNNCNTGHTSGGAGAIVKVDPNSQTLFTTQNGTSGGVVMTNMQYTNYELVMDILPKFGNDAGVFNRSPVSGRCFQASFDYINGGSMGGDWGEGGFPGRDIRPFVFNGNNQTIAIPGNVNGGELSNWTVTTSKLNPTSYGCAPTGCVQADWQRLWDPDWWNEVKVAFYGGSAAGTGNLHLKTWFRKSGTATWVPLVQDTAFVQTLAKGYIGLQIQGGGRFNGPPGNFYRNIKIRELNDLGEPLTLP